MSDRAVLQQAAVAAETGNWSSLGQHLQQLLRDHDASDREGSQRLLEWTLAAFEAGDFHQRWDLAKVLPNFGEMAIAPLVEILEDDLAETQLRWFVTRVLGQFDRPEAIQALVQVLQTAEDEELKAMAAESLTQNGEVAVRVLTPLLNNPESREFAARSLAHVRHPDIIDPLLHLLDDERVEVRSLALKALTGAIDYATSDRYPRLRAALIRKNDDRAAEVRREAVAGLGLYGMRDADGEIVSILRSRLWDFNLSVCQQAAMSLARIGGEMAQRALFDVLRSPATPAPLQIEAIRALGWTAAPTALDGVLTFLRSPQIEPQVLQEAIAVLGRWEVCEMQKSQVVDLLIEQLRYCPSADTLRAIVAALGRLGDSRAIEPLISVLERDDFRLRLHAIAALKSLDGAKECLDRQVSSDRLSPELQRGIAIALEEWNR